MEMMQAVSLNEELSKKVYRSQQRRCQPKMCYHNVYRAVTDFMPKLRSGEWHVAYGYYGLTSLPQGLARHAFLLDEKNQAIDPTIFTHKDPFVSRAYHVMYVFPSLDAYMEAVKSSDYYPDLGRYLQEQTVQAHQWAADNGYFLCG